MTEKCDVLIVGGGPAGSSCAGRLRQSGADVRVIDRKHFPRDKTCAGWVTPQVFETLGVDPMEYAQHHVCQSITGFRTGIIGGRELNTDYGRTVSYGIRRCEFDHFLLDRAGAATYPGEPVQTIRRIDGGWLINDRIQSDALVGAGGHFCPVARMLGRRDGDRLVTVAAQEIEFPLTADAQREVRVTGEVPELFFCNDLAGYGWCFRKGEYLNIGLGRLQSTGLAAHVETFCRFLRDRGKVLCAIPERFRGHAYRLYEKVAPVLVDDGVVLIGDSAGLAYPQSGEGIRPAVESGLLAADVLSAADGNYRRARLEPYAHEIARRFGTPRGREISDRLPAAFLRFIAARLLANRWFTRHVVLDQWFLHSDTPALSPEGTAPLCVAP